MTTTIIVLNKNISLEKNEIRKRVIPMIKKNDNTTHFLHFIFICIVFYNAHKQKNVTEINSHIKHKEKRSDIRPLVRFTDIFVFEKSSIEDLLPSFPYKEKVLRHR